MAGSETIWIAELLISERTAQKLRIKHGLNPADVRRALLATRGLRARRIRDEERGERFLVRSSVNGEDCLAVLHDASSTDADSVWRLATMYKV